MAKSAQRILVDTEVGRLFDSVRYVDSGMVRRQCIRAFELQAGFKLNPFMTRTVELAINQILHSVWNTKGFIPSNRVDAEPIQGVPQYLAIKKDIGWVRTRWDWTEPEDWEGQLEVIVNNEKATAAALDEFEAVYEYVVPLLKKHRKPLGDIIQLRFWDDGE